MVGVDEVVLDQLRLLRDEVNYLKSEREFATSFSVYEENVRLMKAVERSLQLSAEIYLDNRYAEAIYRYIYQDADSDEL